MTPMALSPLLEAAASSSSSEVLRTVETQLKSLEVRPGFHSSLLTIIQHSTDDGTSDVMRLQVLVITSKMCFTNNRLTGLRADKTLLGSTRLSRVQLKTK